MDAVSMPPGEVAAAASAVAESEGIPDDWLNAAAQPWMPPLPDGSSMKPGDEPGLRIEAAPPTHLLAMKIIARRGKRDMDDIELLARALGIHRAQDMYDITVEAYGEAMIESVTRA